MAAEGARVGALRDRLEAGILKGVPGTVVNGAPQLRVPNTTNISFDRVEAESLLIALDLEGIAVSTGSACSSGTLEPSHVLRAMGLPAHRTQNSLRFSLGLFSTGGRSRSGHRGPAAAGGETARPYEENSLRMKQQPRNTKNKASKSFVVAFGFERCGSS